MSDLRSDQAVEAVAHAIDKATGLTSNPGYKRGQSFAAARAAIEAMLGQLPFDLEKFPSPMSQYKALAILNGLKFQEKARSVAVGCNSKSEAFTAGWFACLRDLGLVRDNEEKQK